MHKQQQGKLIARGNRARLARQGVQAALGMSLPLWDSRLPFFGKMLDDKFETFKNVLWPFCGSGKLFCSDAPGPTLRSDKSFVSFRRGLTRFVKVFCFGSGDAQKTAGEVHS